MFSVRYITDHDLHIHSHLSTCSKCPEQTVQRIAQYAREQQLSTVCITDHFWDETVPGASPWYEVQNFPHICKSKPLPQPEGVRFLFGCETEMDKNLTVGISPQRMEEMDFIVIPTTHFHMKFALTEEERETVQGRVSAWLRRLEGVLNQQLPYHKVGLAHLTCHLIGRSREETLQVIASLPEAAMHDLFCRAAQLGVGIELNSADMRFTDEEEDRVLRMFRIAKYHGCKFYCGSDAHHPAGLVNSPAVFLRAIDRLGLQESDKFHIHA
jgi:histidinol phosphatase-like PHP family hydrolase